MATRKAPAGPTGTPGAPGTRYAPSSRKQPKPTGTDPGSPGYGIKTNSTSNPIGKANSLFGTGNRDVPSGQGNLESKVKRSVC
jgi:hypothetical protein